MNWKLLALGVPVVFALAGTVGPGNVSHLFPLAILVFFILSIFALRNRKIPRRTSEQKQKALCDAFRKLIKKHISSVHEPPELGRLISIAGKIGLPVDECMARLEEGTLFDRGLKALVEERYEEAVELITEHIWEAEDPAAEHFFFLGNALSYKGELNNSLIVYYKTTELEPDNNMAWNNWGASLVRLGRTEEGIEKIRKALKIKPDDCYALINLSYAMINNKQYSEAIAIISKAINIKDNYAEAWINWGVALGLIGNINEAIEKFERATEIKQQSDKAWYNWGLALATSRKYEESTEKFDRATEINPDYKHAWYNWGLALKALGREDEAGEKFKRAEELEKKQEERRQGHHPLDHL